VRFPVSEFLAYDVLPEAAKKFSQEISAKFDLKVTPVQTAQ
jgi:hypothetical protein